MVMQHDCDDSAVEKRATRRKPYHFTQSGLPNVWLIGVRYFECPSCGAQSAEIPAVSRLLAVIAGALVEKESKLTGAEIRFLRQRLGKKSVEMAAALGITPETYSKYENDKLGVSETADGLIRALYVFGSGDDHLVDVFRRGLHDILSRRSPDRKPAGIAATIKNRKWQASKAA